MQTEKSNSGSELLTPAELAAELKVEVSTILRWTREGHLPAIRFGRGGRRDPVRFRRGDIDRLIDQRCSVKSGR